MEMQYMEGAGEHTILGPLAQSFPVLISSKLVCLIVFSNVNEDLVPHTIISEPEHVWKNCSDWPRDVLMS